MNVVTIWRAGKKFPAPSPVGLRKMTAAAAELAGLGDLSGSICVSFLSPRGIARVNQAFLGHIGETDVISFDYRTQDDDVSNYSDSMDGDSPAVELIVCPEVAWKESEKRGLPYANEVALYVSHGLLHAAGFDDLVPTEKRKMRRAEKRVMKGLLDRKLIPFMEVKFPESENSPESNSR